MIYAATLCLLAAIALVICEWRRSHLGMALSKCMASSAFVVAAIAVGARDSDHGRMMLAAFVLSWIGDMCLLSSATPWFLSGLGAFLLAHVTFATAFVSLPQHATALATGAVAMVIVGITMMRWLWARLSQPFRIAVSAYVLAIAAMVALAAGASAASGSWWLAIGATAFALSDISVARDRFVAPGMVNRVWGLPLYYTAQLLLVYSLTVS